MTTSHQQSKPNGIIENNRTLLVGPSIQAKHILC